MMKRFLLTSSSHSMPCSRFLQVGLLSILLLLFGCDSTSNGQEVLPADHWFPLVLEGKEVQVQLAVTLAEMRRGLMFREELEEDAGMIFVYPRPQRLSFYMRNTSIPLDIGFFSPEGLLRERYAMYPFDETTVSSRSNQLQFALEMNQGWFADNDISHGARLDLESLRDALLKRGFNPADFDL